MPKDERVTTPPKEVRISDLHLASYLLALGYSLVNIEGSSHRALFLFTDVPQEIIISFYQENATVNPRKLLDSLRNLKGLLIQQERGLR